MELLALALFPAIAVWGGIAVSRASVVTVAVLFLVATSCLPPEYVSFRAAGLGITVDRVTILTMAVAFLLAYKQGRVQLLPLETVDYIALLFFLWLTARTLTQPLGQFSLRSRTH